MKKLTTFLVLSVAACLWLQAQHPEGNPFARLGYKTDVYTFGDKKEFHDQEEIVEIGDVLFNTKTNEVIGFVEATVDSLIKLKPELQSISIDPHCEKYYWISPYAYCLNNPVRFIDPDGKDVAILIAKDGAGGRGHMGAVIQDKRGNYYYMTMGNTDGRAGTLGGIASGADGKMALIQLEFGDDKPSMEKAIEIVGNIDKSNSAYTDNIILETSSKMDNDILTNAAVQKNSFDEKNIKYNAITNNCADAVTNVIEKGTGVTLPVGLSPSPNSQFGNIKENKSQIQSEIDKKRKNEEK